MVGVAWTEPWCSVALVAVLHPMARTNLPGTIRNRVKFKGRVKVVGPELGLGKGSWLGLGLGLGKLSRNGNQDVRVRVRCFVSYG